MFCVSLSDINGILKDYGAASEAAQFTELQRYHYEQEDPDSREVRLIIKAQLNDGAAVVIRFKNESDAGLELIESQCRFAELLHTSGIPSPRQYQANGCFANTYLINGYEVIVCVEEFVEGEIKLVDQETAYKTGALLARTHTIAEGANAHVAGDVLFDPFRDNDLFFFQEFEELCRPLEGEARSLSRKIIGKYHEYMEVLSPLKEAPRYAVQGDISDCNLFRTPHGEIGIFDFNRCGDNELYCDAVMQAVFEARLMDYPDSCQENTEGILLPAFLKGYQSVRPFTDLQRDLLPYLYTVITSFWSQDIWWGENSLRNTLESGSMEAGQEQLNAIWQRISKLPAPEQLLGPDGVS